MREIFTYGSVGGAPGNRCFYPEADRKKRAPADAKRTAQLKFRLGNIGLFSYFLISFN